MIGYDDTLDAPYSSPPLTTISPDKKVLASTALDLLAERIQGYDGPPRVVETPYSLVVRQHPGPPRAKGFLMTIPTPYEDLLREVMETGTPRATAPAPAPAASSASRSASTCRRGSR